MNGLLGKKIMMHQLFTENGDVVPVTFFEILPNTVTQVKTVMKDGYNALQIVSGYQKKPKLIKKSIKGHLAKSNSQNQVFLQEFRDMKGFKLGDKISLAIFQEGQYVDIQALSKGKGTSGVIKRHNFSRGPMTHGSKHHRAPGSTGISRADKVWKGQPLPGRKGNVKTTVQNLQIVKIDFSHNLLIIKGSAPGNNNSYCRISFSLKKKAIATIKPLINWEQAAKVTSLKEKPSLSSSNKKAELTKPKNLINSSTTGTLPKNEAKKAQQGEKNLD